MWIADLHLRDRLAEIPYRLRSPAHIADPTWILSETDLARVTVNWPIRYQWPPSGFIVETIKDAMGRLGVMRMADTRQKYEGVFFLYCLVDGHDFRVALDYSDYHDFINEPALSECDLYLKGQYMVGGYGDSKIVPGGYTVTTRRYYKFYQPFRRDGNVSPSLGIVARFGYTFQGDFRRRAVGLLADAGDIPLAGNTGKVRYSRFLREVASARLSLQLPGNGPFTHRVIEFLGLGTCMLSVPLSAQLHVPLVPGVHFVEVAADLSDLVEKVRFYLAHEEERLRIAQAGREHFDRYLHCEQLVRYYVRTILDAYDARITVADKNALPEGGSGQPSGVLPSRDSRWEK